MTPGAGRRVAFGIAGALALVLTPNCDVAPGPISSNAGDGSDAGIAAAGVRIASAAWRFTWKLDGVTRLPGGGIEMENDLGYRVQIKSGHFTDHSVSLGLCNPTLPPDLGAWLLPFHLGVRAAQAHEELDRSAIELALDEDLANPTDQGDFRTVFPAAAYCRAHWLLAIPGSGPGGLGMDVAQTSIEIKGTWSRGGQSGELRVRTWWPEARIVDVAAVVADPAALRAAQSDGAPRNARVTVERRLGGLFDSIDFATAGSDQITGQILINLVDTSRVRVDLDR